MNIPKRPEGSRDEWECPVDYDEALSEHRHAVAKAAVEALECLLAGQKGDQLIMNPDEFIRAVLARIEASGWTAEE